MRPPSRAPGFLYGLAVLVAAATVGLWLFTGAHFGWTRTTVTEMQHDEVTGIDYPVQRDQFVAGVEVLVLGTAATAALGLAGALLARRRPREN